VLPNVAVFFCSHFSAASTMAFFPEHEFWKKGKLQPMLAFFLLIWVFGPNRLKP
jgi:hypothetical protein